MQDLEELNINKNIIQELENDFTISLWCQGSGDIFKVFNTGDYIKVTIGTNSISIKGVSVSGVTLNVGQYNHIVITGLNQVITAVYVNGTKFSTNVNIGSYTFNYDNDQITLKTDVKYYDLRIFNKTLSDTKITSLYNIGINIDTGATLGDAGGYHKKITGTFNVNLNGDTATTISLWVYCDDADYDIITFTGFKLGVKDKRFYVETTDKVFSNRKLSSTSAYYFITFVIDNESDSHILKLFVDNFPGIGKKIKDVFTFADFTTNDVSTDSSKYIEDVLVYDKHLNDTEILDSYIADVKLKATTAELHSLSYLFSDYSKDIDSDTTSLYGLHLHSTSNLVEVTTTVTTTVDTVVEVEGGGGGETTQETETTETTEETNEYDIYKFNKYPGYVGFKNDLYAWYKFEKANTEPITSIAPNMIDSSNVYLAFKHDGSTFLIDFEPYTIQSTWTNYINSLQTDGLVQSYDLDYILSPNYTTAVFKASTHIGYIDFIIPSGYNACDITYGWIADDPTQVKINNVDVDSTTDNLKTYTATNLVSGQIIRIYEIHGQINRIIKLFYYNSQTSYTVNFPEDTTCDILIVGGGGGGARRMAGGGGAGSLIYDTNIILNGTYTIKVGKGGSGSATAGNTNTNNDNIGDKRGDNGVDSEIIKSSSTIYKAKGGGGGLGGNTDNTIPSSQQPLSGGSGGGNGGKDNGHGGLCR